MTALRARPYRPQDEAAWDDLVARSWNGTFIHRRRYIDCTRERYRDLSLVLEDGRKLIAVFPGAEHIGNPETVESHPATGFGGLVHDGGLTGSKMREALEAVADRYFHDGKRVLRYQPPPLVYHRVPAEDDRYALFVLGATRSRCDLSGVIDLAFRPRPRKGRRSSVRKAERSQVEVADGDARLAEFWSILTGRLRDKHQAEPRHSFGEVEAIMRSFPAEVRCVVATVASRVVAGAVLYRSGRVDHAQYLAADDRGYETAALDLLLERSIARAYADGARYFSFGNSTLYGGRVLNDGLHSFKSGFGAGGVVYEAYDLPLS